jgi:hypothetical protein
MAPLLLLFFVFIFSLYKLYIGVRSREMVSIVTAYNLYMGTFFLSLFVWWAHFTGETMLATRFLLYVYFLTGPIILLALVEVPNKKVFSTIVLITMPLYFGYTIVNGVWTYAGDGIWTSFALLIYEAWS